MAQGSIRKGFLFYFGLFILLLVTVFLICIVIMMFNPGKTVLWMRYFSGKEDKVVTQTTAVEGGAMAHDIDFSGINEIEVKGNYAKVTVQRNKEYVHDGIVIRNHAKGFVGAKKYHAFSYKITQEGSKIVIDLNEPTGFMYFSKDIEVIINDATTEEKIKLENIKLKVTMTGNSDVYIGGTTNKEEQEFGLDSLCVSTSKGDITLGRYFNAGAIKTAIGGDGDAKDFGLYLYTGKGKISSLRTVAFGVKSGNGFQQSNQNVFIGTNKGRVNFDIVNTGSKTLQLENRKGTVAIGEIHAGLVEVVNAINGNYKLGTVACDLTYEKSGDTIVTPIINIDDITGNFTLHAEGPKDAPIVKIKNAEQKVTMTASKGSVTVSNAKGEVDVVSGTSMAVNVTFDKENTNKIHIENNKGKITLKFKGAVSTDARIETKKSDVNIQFTKNANFTASCKKADKTTPATTKKVKVSIGKSGVKYDYNKDQGEITFSSGETAKGTISVNTDEEINFKVVNA